MTFRKARTVAENATPRIGAPKILIVEDEASLARGIAFNLRLENYSVDCVSDGREAATLLSKPGPRSAGDHDLVILDVMLPGLDGFSVVRQARDHGNRTPVLMLTAKGLPEDMVEGLESGADDYLAKPFDLAVLLARVKSLLRRKDWSSGGENHDGQDAGPVHVGLAEIDFANFEARRDQSVTHLTLLEAGFLRLLWEKRGTVVSKKEILERVWNLHPETETRAIDNFVVRLRRIVEDDPKEPRFLVTVRGAGYKLEVE